MNPLRARSPGRPYVLLGGLCGITWAAGFRGWMAQLVGEESTYGWSTFVLILLPGLVVGMLLGHAASARSRGLPSPRSLVFAPVLFASALLEPQIARALVTTGQGSGALIVIATALAGGFALSRRRWTGARASASVLALLGLLLITGISTMAAPLDSARGAWVASYGLSFMLLLCLAAVLPYAPVRSPRGRGSYAGLGALGGLAWACALRDLTAAMDGSEPGVDWVGTWVFILLPGALIGALLGWAEHIRRTGGRPRRRWLSRSGRLWGRVRAVVVGAAMLVVWPVTGLPSLADPRGLWATVLYGGLLVLLALATSVSLRPAATLRPQPLPTTSTKGTDREQAIPA